ncbi:MAG: 3-methyl-2-oxobutanoate hydroxymethyltransferase [Clostridiaceae bacterium]|jgi:3-methyl-2-oxobutanoate hydroxymethyltransferase|nr:3-methyl-2-oxobutanoate hydroxymethyltransferase [Clostridiaceae bacterium]
MIKKISVNTIQKMKNSGEKISMITAYDCSMAKYVDEAGIDMILVGDSVAMVILGYDTTCAIGMNEMKIFTKAVTTGAKRSLVVADMPFLSVGPDIAQSVKNAGELIKCGATAVKMEGASDSILKTIRACVDCGIPVCAHLGFTPQFLNTIGGYNVQGKTFEATEKLLEDSYAVQKAGAFALVLEMVPEESAKYITEKLNIPTIGIGAGRYTSGQVLVSDDVLGKYSEFKPKFVRRYADMKKLIIDGVSGYNNDVKSGAFPSEDEIFHVDEECKTQLFCAK